MSPRAFAASLLFAAASLPMIAPESHAAAQPPASTTAAAFNPDSVPVSRKTLPGFPYIDWPAQLPGKLRRAKVQDFDRAWFVAGAAPHAAEGRVERRRYPLSRAKLSKVEAIRNYENALAELGAVRVDTMQPSNKNFPAKNRGGRHAFVRDNLGITGDGLRYSTYLLRTPEKRVWIGLGVTNAAVDITTLEEKSLEQSIALTKADEMKADLDKQGFVALYINFDTDKSTLRDDGKPAVDEIAKLLKANPGLKVAVEGHTDNSGEPKRNKALSERRAATIVAALKGAGIEGARLKSAGHGADKPIADNRTEEGRAKNRRVELVKI